MTVYRQNGLRWEERRNKLKDARKEAEKRRERNLYAYDVSIPVYREAILERQRLRRAA